MFVASSTTANIFPQRLAFDRGSSASDLCQTFDKRRIGFALVLEPTPKRTKSLKAIGIELCNQTDYTPLRRTPIAVSIETKTKDGNENEAEAQIGIWVAAQFKHLRESLGDIPPFLPLLIVVGTEWHLLVARQEEQQDEEQDEEQSEPSSIGMKTYKAIIWSRHLLGKSSRISGVFQIIAALGMLCRWAATDYNEWWEAHLP